MTMILGKFYAFSFQGKSKTPYQLTQKCLLVVSRLARPVDLRGSLAIVPNLRIILAGEPRRGGEGGSGYPYLCGSHIHITWISTGWLCCLSIPGKPQKRKQILELHRVASLSYQINFATATNLLPAPQKTRSKPAWSKALISPTFLSPSPNPRKKSHPDVYFFKGSKETQSFYTLFRALIKRRFSSLDGKKERKQWL